MRRLIVKERDITLSAANFPDLTEGLSKQSSESLSLETSMIINPTLLR
jgi:hypothetical protein